jgi:hypothetical protein
VVGLHVVDEQVVQLPARPECGRRFQRRCGRRPCPRCRKELSFRPAER